MRAWWHGFKLPKGGRWTWVPFRLPGQLTPEPLGWLPVVSYWWRRSTWTGILAAVVWAILPKAMLPVALLPFFMMPIEGAAGSIGVPNGGSPPPFSSTIVASAFPGTKEQKVTAAGATASSLGMFYVFLSKAMLPYDASQVTFYPTVRYIREGGNHAVWDVQAYGASGAYATTSVASTDTYSFVAAVAGAGTVGGTVYVPTPSGSGTPAPIGYGVGYLLGAGGAYSATAILGLTNGVTIEGANHESTIITLADGANRSVFEIPWGVQGIKIKSLHIDGNKANQAGTSHGLRLIGTGVYNDGQHKFTDLQIFNTLTDGFFAENQHSNYEATGLAVRSPGRFGFNVGASDGFFVNCYVNLSGDNGWELLVGFNHFVQCSTYACGKHGIHIGASGTHNNFYNCDIDSSQQHNIYIQASQSSFVSGVSRDPGQLATNTYSHVATDGGLDGVRVTGTDFKAKSHANQAQFCIQVGGANGLTAAAFGNNSYETGSFNVAPMYAAGGGFGLRCFLGRSPSSTIVAYSANMTIDLALVVPGDEYEIVATNGVAFAVGITNTPADNHVFTVRLSNTSGGALGAITWSGNFKQAGIVSPATGFSRLLQFQVIGAGTVRLVSQSPADIPN